jgi:sugar (pentulose or hexulose) kinase
MTYFLGIDTSTTASKALIIDERGEVLAMAS